MSFVVDSFTDVDGTTLLAHTGETGATWTRHPAYSTGAWVIESDRLGCSTATALALASGVPASANYDVQATLHTLTDTGKPGIVGRCDPTAATAYFVEYNVDQIQLGKLVATARTVFGSFALTPSVGSDHTIMLRMSGSSIELWVDGVQEYVQTDLSITEAGFAGVTANQKSGVGAGVWLDDFSATDGVTPPLTNVLVGGVWTPKPVYVFDGSTWAEKPVEWFSGPASPWIGDYSTGDASQWNSAQLTNAESLTFVTSPRRTASGYAGRFEINPGENDGIPPLDRDRAELAASTDQTDGYAGQECWYGWSTYFPDGTPAGEEFNPANSIAGLTDVFTQIHEHNPSWNVPPVRFVIVSASDPLLLRCKVAGGGSYPVPSTVIDHDLGVLTYNVWWDFVFHVKWEYDTAGFVEIWAGEAGTLDSASPTVAKTFEATCYPTSGAYTDQGVYLKQGFYKDRNALQTIIYHDQTKRGASFTDVVPGG